MTLKCNWFTFQIFKGTFHYCEGNSRVKNKEECLKSSNGHWENHMYNFDNLPQVNMNSLGSI